MSRKYVALEIAAAFVFLAAPTAPAEEYELGYKITDPTQEGVYVRGEYPRASTQPGEKLSAEPKYQSKNPIYLVAELGLNADNRYTLVLDESKGTGKGYDTLYVDRNNNEDLTDDPKVGGRLQERGARFTIGNFGPVEVMIDYGDRTVPYSFSLEYSGSAQLLQPYFSKKGPIPSWDLSVTLRPAGYYTGVVSFGGSKLQIAFIDCNGNGVFNEYFKPRFDIRPSGDRLHGIGDQLLIDLNRDGRFDGAYPDYRELYPYAKYLQVNGNWYSLAVAEHGGKVVVESPALKLGTVRITQPSVSYSLQLLSETGVRKLEGKHREFQVPAGTYQVYTHTAEVTRSSGKWRYEAQRTEESGKKFKVVEGAVSELRIGPPILMNVSVGYWPQGPRPDEPNAGPTLGLSLTLSTEGGERYTNIKKNGDLPPEPTYKILDEAGRALQTGSFEWG